jgi:hypothetical protein
MCLLISFLSFYQAPQKSQQKHTLLMVFPLSYTPLSFRKFNFSY